MDNFEPKNDSTKEWNNWRKVDNFDQKIDSSTSCLDSVLLNLSFTQSLRYKLTYIWTGKAILRFEGKEKKTETSSYNFATKY